MAKSPEQKEPLRENGLSPEDKAAAKQEILECLAKKGQGSFWAAIAIKRKSGLSGDFIFESPAAQGIVKQALIESLNRRHIDEAVTIRQDLEVPDVVVGSPEVQKAAQEKAIRCLNEKEIIARYATHQGAYSGSVWDAIDCAKRFNLSPEFLRSPEVREAAKRAMIRCLSTQSDGILRVKDAGVIQETFNLPSEFISSPEIGGAVSKILTKYIHEAKDAESVGPRKELSARLRRRLGLLE